MARRHFGSDIGNLCLLREKFELGLASTSAYQRYVSGSHDCLRRLKIAKKFPIHDGCVNTVVWSEDGRFILSGSDDRHLGVVNPFAVTFTPVRIPCGHSDKIFSAKYLPFCDSNLIISGACDGSVILTDVSRPDTYGKHKYSCHHHAVYEVAAFPDDPYTFLSCGEDGYVRLFDRREKTSCVRCTDDVIISCAQSVCAIDVCPTNPYSLATGLSDGCVRLYDIRLRSKGRTHDPETLGATSHFRLPDDYCLHRVTSLDFSPDGSAILVSFSAEGVYLLRNDAFSHAHDVANQSEKSIGVVRIRRLRFRGDWSDTGPLARPLSERGHSGETVSLTRVGRLISFLSRCLGRNLTEQTARSTLELLQNQMMPAADSDANGLSHLPSDEIRSSGGDLHGGRTTSATNTASNTDCEASVSSENAGFVDESGCDQGPSSSTKPCAERPNIPFHVVAAKFFGHRNTRTVLKQANFWGENFVFSGSDCGHVFAWQKDSGEVVDAFEGDRHVVNCVQPHPFYPFLATSGIDHDVKFWSLSADAAPVANNALEEIVERNTVMTEETRDTLTVPASFLIRMLFYLDLLRSRSNNNPSSPRDAST